MNVFECIKTRRSNRAFLNKAINQEELDTIIEAGRYAPSGGNNQSTHIFVVKNKEILNELASLAQIEFSKMEVVEGMYRSLQNSIVQSKKGNYVFHYNAPVLVIVTNKKGYGNAMADCSCVLENMMLMANELHIGTCWINQLHWLDENKVIRDYLKKIGIEDDQTICGSLSIGYCENLRQMETERKGNIVTTIE